MLSLALCLLHTCICKRYLITIYVCVCVNTSCIVEHHRCCFLLVILIFLSMPKVVFATCAAIEQLGAAGAVLPVASSTASATRRGAKRIASSVAVRGRGRKKVSCVV